MTFELHLSDVRILRNFIKLVPVSSIQVESSAKVQSRSYFASFI